MDPNYDPDFDEDLQRAINESMGIVVNPDFIQQPIINDKSNDEDNDELLRAIRASLESDIPNPDEDFARALQLSQLPDTSDDKALQIALSESLKEEDPSYDLDINEPDYDPELDPQYHAMMNPYVPPNPDSIDIGKIYNEVRSIHNISDKFDELVKPIDPIDPNDIVVSDDEQDEQLDGHMNNQIITDHVDVPNVEPIIEQPIEQSNEQPNVVPVVEPIVNNPIIEPIIKPIVNPIVNPSMNQNNVPTKQFDLRTERKNHIRWHREFSKNYNALSINYCDTKTTRDKILFQNGDKAILPISALQELSNLDVSLYVLRVSNPKSGKFTFVCATEFTAPENSMYIPDWVFEKIECQHTDNVHVDAATIPVITDVTVRIPKGLYNPLPIVEFALRNHSLMFMKKKLIIKMFEKQYIFEIIRLEPANLGSIIHADVKLKTEIAN